MNSFRKLTERLGISTLGPQDQANLLTIALMYALLGVAGSVFSAIVVVCCLYTLFRLPWRDGIAAVPRPILAVSVAGVLYFTSGLLMFVFNPEDPQTIDVLLERLPFLFVLPLAMQLALTDRHLLRNYLEVGCIGAGLAIGFWILFQLPQLELLFRGDVRVVGGSGNAGPFATTCAFVSSVCFAAAIDQSGVRRRLLLFAGVIAIMGIVASGMRLFFPFFVALPVVLAFVYRGKLRGLLSPKNVVPLLISLILIGFVAWVFVIPRLMVLGDSLENFAFSPNATTSLGLRMTLWVCASEILPDIWVLGAGPSAASEYMNSCALDLIGFELGFTHFHNFLITALMQGGVIEAIVVSVLVFAPALLLLGAAFRKKLAPIERFALAVTVLVGFTYLLQGSLNLMFGHDIHDLLFIHSMSLLLTIFFYRETRRPIQYRNSRDAD